MYITSVPNRKSPPAILLRESYREDGKVQSHTLANLTHWDPLRVDAMKKALKGEFDGINGVPEVGESFGTLFVLKQIASEIGLTKALGRTREAVLSLFLILARVAHHGSRLSAVRWAKYHAVHDILGLEDFDENHLYKTLDWLEANQEKIEKKLFDNYISKHNKPSMMALYDVTSSYFEGTHNELSEFGYNRDKKKGKRQIVIGLLTSEDGEPLAVRVFRGNTSDPSTIRDQIELIRNNFGIEKVVLVGDKGMIRSTGKSQINEENWNYITTLSKMEIESLVNKGPVQYTFFDSELYEIEHESKRYILRRNGLITDHLRHEREKRIERMLTKVKSRNEYVKDHPRANIEKGLVNLEKISERLRLNKFISLSIENKEILVHIDRKRQEELFILDGCYVMETDVKKERLNKEEVDKMYRNLHKVESNFRDMKTNFLEIRPIFLRKANRTKGHVFVSMLALKVMLHFKRKLKEKYETTKDGLYNMTLEEALNDLDRLNFMHYECNGKRTTRLSKPNKIQGELLSLFHCQLPNHKNVGSKSI